MLLLVWWVGKLQNTVTKNSSIEKSHYVCSFQDPKGFSVEKPRLCEAKPFGSALDKKTKVQR
jgi:hypothetical protein